MPPEGTLKSQECFVGNASREWTPSEMLFMKAEELRQEAFELEALARDLQSVGSLSRDAERALRNTLARAIYR